MEDTVKGTCVWAARDLGAVAQQLKDKDSISPWDHEELHNLLDATWSYLHTLESTDIGCGCQLKANHEELKDEIRKLDPKLNEEPHDQRERLQKLAESLLGPISCPR